MLELMSFLATPMMANGLPFPEFSPALFSIDFGFAGLGVFHLRWYALAYIGGISLAWWYSAAMFARPKLWTGPPPLDKDGLDDIMFLIILGIILGGRLGYVLFYMVPYQWDTIAANPLALLRIWDGGMSFHGGILGVVIAIVWYAKKHGAKLFSLGDVAGVVAPIGIGFGRLANFTNAELYGRHTDAPLGVVFPEGYVPGSTPPAYDFGAKEWVYSGMEMARHPSQLYEAALEGFLPLAILSLLIWKFDALKKPGLVAGLFLLMYATGRSIVENFREPDGFVSGLPGFLTMGMLLSIPMWIGGAWLVWNALKSKPLHKID